VLDKKYILYQKTACTKEKAKQNMNKLQIIFSNALDTLKEILKDEK